jgi:hypothetical protein
LASVGVKAADAIMLLTSLRGFGGRPGPFLTMCSNIVDFGLNSANVMFYLNGELIVPHLPLMGPPIGCA